MPAHAGPEALQLFSDNLLQHVPIERQIGHEAFQLGILLTELPQFAQFAEAEPRILPLPHVERLLADPHLPADVHHGRAPLHLPQGGQYLFLGMPTSSCHRRVLLLCQEDHALAPFLKQPLAYFLGFGSLLITTVRDGASLREWTMGSATFADHLTALEIVYCLIHRRILMDTQLGFLKDRYRSITHSYTL